MMLFTSPEMNETSAAPARSGLTAATGPDADVAAGAIVFGEQLRVALRRRQRRIAVLEGQRRLGLRQRRLGDDRLHRVARVLRAAPSTASADRRAPIARLGDHVGLAGCATPRAEHLVDVHRRAAEDQAGIEREVLLARQLAAEAVEDPRQLVVGAVAELGPEDLRRVPGLRLDLELPRRGAAARRHGELRIAGAVLEAERVLRPLRRVDERRARGGLRIAGILFVARS